MSRRRSIPWGSRMPDHAWRRIAAVLVGVAAAGRVLLASAGAGPRVRSRLHGLRRWGVRARLRLMARLKPAAGLLPLRNLVTRLGGIVALVTALSIPIGYGIIGY